MISPKVFFLDLIKQPRPQLRTGLYEVVLKFQFEMGRHWGGYLFFRDLL